MNAFISVIIPTYNRCDRLKKTIESVLNQTVSDFELLICDDGSTDDTENMVKTFDDPKVRWLPGANTGGPASPRNRGISEAKGEWLAFLDSDDLWEPEKLEKQLEVIKDKSIKAVCTNAKISVNDTLLSKTYFDFQEDKIYTFSDMLQVNWVICSSMMIHHSIVKSVGGFPETPDYKAIEDYAMWLATSMITDVYFINDPLIIYRDEPIDSIRGEVQDEEFLKHKKVLIEALRRTNVLKNKKNYYRYRICKFMIRMYLIQSKT